MKKRNKILKRNKHPTGQKLARQINIGAVDVENRTAEIAWASEFRVERWFGSEILKCDADSVQLQRLQDMGVLLFNHDMDRPIGKILDPRIDADRICRATIQFDEDPDSDIIFQKVVNGSLKAISTGYLVNRWEEIADGTTSSDGRFQGPASVATSWEPYEISVVSVPADPSVGIGRSLKIEGEKKVKYKTRHARKLQRLSQRFARAIKRKSDEGIRSVADDIEALIDDVEQELEGTTAEELAEVKTEIAAVVAEVEAIAEEAIENAETAEAVVEAAQEVLDIVEGAEPIDGGTGGEGNDGGARSGGAAGAAPNAQPQQPMSTSRTDGVSRRQLRERLLLCRNFGLDPLLAETQTADQLRKLILDERSKGGAPVGNQPSVEVQKEQSDKFIRSAEAALLLRAGKTVSKEDQEMVGHLRGMSILEIGREHLRLVENANPTTKDELVRALMANASSTGFAHVLANVAQNQLMAGYEVAPTTYQLLSRKGSLKDYKPAKRSRLNNFGILPRVPEGAEYEQAILSDVGAEITLGKYGNTFAITRETLINDDLGAFTDIPYKMGLASRFTIEYAFYNLLLNGKAPDGTPLFSASHNNLTSPGSGITVESLSALIAKMRRQTDLPTTEGEQGYPIIIDPKFLLVPSELETAALQLIASTVDPSKQNDVMNPFQNRLEVIQTPYLSDKKAWYALANPQISDTIEIAYLDGNEAPFMEEVEVSKNDTRQYKVRLEFGASILDYKAMAKNVGQ
jgi:Mu-like prophage major head subunit gpT